MDQYEVVEAEFCLPEQRNPDDPGFCGSLWLYLEFKYRGERDLPLVEGAELRIPTSNMGEVESRVVDLVTTEYSPDPSWSSEKSSRIFFEMRQYLVEVPKEAVVSLKPGDLVLVERK
ncbi:MAG: hypothetical protein HY291_01855 [Planctomycetes bacterium]|nr:hypothetical protein [Planctomycetota bacterium]